MEGRTKRRRAGNQVLVLLSVVVASVAVDQISKWWAWRHVDRVTVDIGGGVVNEFVGGLATSVMQDPLAGAVADAVLVAVLLVAAQRLVARERTRPVLLAGSALVAAGTSNLLDRFGLHRVTAPGSARGVVNWIGLGGGNSSPVNAADLITAAAVIALGVVALARVARLRVASRRLRVAVMCAGIATVGLSVTGAWHARDGVLAAAPAAHGTVIRTPGAPIVAARQRIDLGAPSASVGDTAWRDDIEDVELDGRMVTVTWASERVGVVTRTVLGWRADGVSSLYLYAMVVGPTTVEVYLPSPGSGAGLCLWRAVRPAGRNRPAAWECNAGTPPLQLLRKPVLFS